MCLPKPEEPYDAYKTGDYPRWERAYTRFGKVKDKLAYGEIDDATRARLLEKKGKLGKKVKNLGKRVDDDPSAELAMREHERQRDIKRGQRKIDTHFGQFDDGYYTGYEQKYVDFYNPQLDRQFADARGKLIAALAGRGTLESTAGFGKMTDLQEEKDLAATTIANEAQDAANKLRSNVENAKTNLYSLNESAADPKAANALAKGQATALVAPPAFSPLGQVFASFLAPLAAGLQSRRASPGAGYGPSIYPVQPSGSGSGAVYG